MLSRSHRVEFLVPYGHVPREEVPLRDICSSTGDDAIATESVLGEESTANRIILAMDYLSLLVQGPQKLRTAISLC